MSSEETAPLVHPPAQTPQSTLSVPQYGTEGRSLSREDLSLLSSHRHSHHHHHRHHHHHSSTGSSNSGSGSDGHQKRSIWGRMRDAFAENLKSMLYGGMDGITTVFVSVATVYSGGVTMEAVFIIGIAKLVSGALSMGIGDYMSTKARLELTKMERKREMWECENYLKGEKEEMIEIYCERGVSHENATHMVDIMSKNTEAFVDVMMVEELGLSSQVDEWEPIKNGTVNFFSFVFFGIIPLLIYAGFAIAHKIMSLQEGEGLELDANLIFGIDCGIFILALVFMGLLKSSFSSQTWWMAIFVTLIVGFVAAGSGFGVAYLLEVILNIQGV